MKVVADSGGGGNSDDNSGSSKYNQNDVDGRYDNDISILSLLQRWLSR